jgi:DNA-binding CsgD family transcriptional regulator
MSEMDVLSLLIGDIYDAALDPTLWTPVLANAAAFVGGISATLFTKDASSKSGGVFYDDGGIDAHYKQLYFERYIKLDPATTAHYFATIDEPMATADLVPYDEFVQSRFYLEWARPQKLVDFVTSTLDKSATSAAFFGVFRHERDGIVDGATRRRMRQIAPHIRRAVLVGRAIDLKAAEAAALTDVLDGISAGMFLVDANGHIVHANVAGHAILQDEDYLFTVRGRLAANESAADQALRDIFAAASNGDAALGARGISVPLTARGGKRHVAHVLSLTSGARNKARSSSAAVAALFVHEASAAVPSPPEIIANAYKLTPTELRVLLAIVEVGGVPAVAEALGVAGETVRTHLGNIYVKMGVNRQADLVKLVAGFSQPLLR